MLPATSVPSRNCHVVSSCLHALPLKQLWSNEMSPIESLVFCQGPSSQFVKGGRRYIMFLIDVYHLDVQVTMEIQDWALLSWIQNSRCHSLIWCLPHLKSQLHNWSLHIFAYLCNMLVQYSLHIFCISTCVFLLAFLHSVPHFEVTAVTPRQAEKSRGRCSWPNRWHNACGNRCESWLSHRLDIRK